MMIMRMSHQAAFGSRTLGTPFAESASGVESASFLPGGVVATVDPTLGLHQHMQKFKCTGRGNTDVIEITSATQFPASEHRLSRFL